MLKVLTAVLALFLATPAIAEDWRYEGGSIPIAYVDNGVAQFHFACRGGELAMGFWVRSPQRQVAGASAMNLALTVAGDTSFAQDMPLIHSEGSSMIIRGPVARQWARVARQARDGIEVAYAHKGASGLEFFDQNAFGARGSAAAIGKVLDRCG